MKSLAFLAVLALSFQVFATEEAIIGEDGRMLSYDRSVGRLRPSKGSSLLFCTATLVGKSCAITAGHCSPTFGNVGFDIPVKSNKITNASKENQYQVLSEGRFIVSNDKGQDWAVLRLGKNKVTGKYPGEVRPFKKISTTLPAIDAKVSLTGYGGDDWQASEEQGGRRRPRPTPPPPGYVNHSFMQQRGYGRFLGKHNTYVEHSVDTMGGNSGGSIVDDESDSIFAIHTHGDSERQINSGTVIVGNDPVMDGIRNCLEWESTLPEN